jgi:hypothetical protein
MARKSSKAPAPIRKAANETPHSPEEIHMLEAAEQVTVPPMSFMKAASGTPPPVKHDTRKAR